MDTSQVSVPVDETPRQDTGPSAPTLSKGTLLAGILTGIAASTCCIGPLVLLALGVSGSWIGSLSAFEPYRPYLMAITLLFFGLAYRKLYWIPQSCAVDAPCVSATHLRRQRITFWVVSALVMLIMSFPWYGVYLLD